MQKPAYRTLIWTAIGVLLLLLGPLCGICYYEDHEDPYLTVLSQGNLTGGPQLIPNTLGVWFGITRLMLVAYQHSPGFDWYAVCLLLGYILLIYQLVSAVINLQYHLNGSKSIAYALLLVLAITFSENLLLWQLTRLSLLLAGISMFNMWYGLTFSNSKKILSAKFLFSLACFTYAGIIRIEPATLVLALCLPLFIISFLLDKKLKAYLPLLMPAFVIIALSVLVNTSFNNTDSKYLEFRKYQFSLFDFKQPSSSMRLESYRDSVIFNAATLAFVNDSQNINPAFFKRIGVLPLDKTVSSIPHYFQNLSSAPLKLKRSAFRILEANAGLVLIYFFTSLFIGHSFFKSGGKCFYGFTLAQLWAIALYVGVTSFMKMENRVLAPMLWCFILINFSFWVYLLPEEALTLRKTLKWKAFIILIVVAAVIDGNNTYRHWGYRLEDKSQTNALFTKLNQRQEQIIVVGATFISRLHLQPFSQNAVLSGKKLVSIDNCFYWMLPGYAPYVERVCGTSDAVGAVRNFEIQKQNVLFASTQGRIDLMQQYFSAVYNMPLNFLLLTDLLPADVATKSPGAKAALPKVYKLQ